MDIRRWPFDQIMQLPDCCFGRRWPIYFGGETLSSAATYHISEMGLPERCVLWDIFFDSEGYPTTDEVGTPPNISIALGDQLPENAAMFGALETLIPESDTIIGGLNVLIKGMKLSLRKPVFTSGRRVAVQIVGSDGTSGFWSLGLVFSSVPNEVPDCLLSV